jgi:hypothetical protein
MMRKWIEGNTNHCLDWTPVKNKPLHPAPKQTCKVACVVSSTAQGDHQDEIRIIYGLMIIVQFAPGRTQRS